ncbi:alanine--tRNA ligase [Rasiella sp. SM2506]|uniref:alanine--tRNA ligase n=1 Tax=Rasiella sp. SM2506 TaxID=3423914 RepID=UPI003D7A4A23
MNSSEIRSKFLQYFKSKEHKIVPSSPMVIKNDPTLMFTNAGMVPFKEYFLGNKEVKNSRITDTQKCLRVSGKHNDLEEVGMDTYHHTMFEMLGNWSFGDYFKKEAITWAWELLTEVYAIDKDILYVTIFEGDAEDNLDRDTEAYHLWKQYVAEDRILNGNKKDNFWEMGEQGPCGPCSEIHVDIRSAEEKAKVSGASLVNQDHPQVVEIWNLVFMQFNRKANGSLEKLPAQHVDTGMGFERLAMVLQGKQSNYDTDVFTPLIREVEAVTNSKYGNDEKVDIAIRVISDHIRAVSFSIADGQLPSNTGAGYVIRRILRRAIRYGFTFLDTKEPFIFKLIETLTQQMGEAFPELKKEKNLITNVIKEEEKSFLRTLSDGMVLLENIINTSSAKEISGAKVFELKDTYGFPEDLTELILRERGYTYNHVEFENKLKKQQEKARAATKVATGDWVTLEDDPEQEFVGYDTLETDVRITRYRKTESKKEGELYQLVFNLTPFYPEGGGQVGDKGYLEAPNGEVVYIVDTKKENNLIVHFAKNLPRSTDGTFKAVVDGKQRSRTASNHTATHLLHQALRNILGEHVEQKGSMVHSGNLRFDFSHFSKVTEEQLREVEDFVNARIREGIALTERRGIPYQQAIDEGAIALFGEKYGDAVRAIKFGKSMELCGGTHVANTNEIWHFIITSEGAVASGIRRIEAITGDAAKSYFEDRSKAFKEVQKLLNNTKDPVSSIEKLQEENSGLQKQLEELLKDKAKNIKGDLKNEIEVINNVNFLAKEVDLDAGGLKDLAFELGGEIDNLFILFGSKIDGKALLTCYISKELATEKKLNAGQIVRELGKHIQGGGGGQPFFATAGGKNPDGIEKALEAARDFIQ